jgi:hypothetical protein
MTISIIVGAIIVVAALIYLFRSKAKEPSYLGSMHISRENSE